MERGRLFTFRCLHSGGLLSLKNDLNEADLLEEDSITGANGSPLSDYSSYAKFVDYITLMVCPCSLSHHPNMHSSFRSLWERHTTTTLPPKEQRPDPTRLSPPALTTGSEVFQIRLLSGSNLGFRLAGFFWYFLSESTPYIIHSH